MKPRRSKPEIMTRNPPRKAVADTDRLFVNSLAKAIKVLDAFGGQEPQLTITEISRNTGLHMSAAQRFTHSLTQMKLLEKDPRSKLYRLSPRLLDFAYFYLRSDRLTSVAQPHLLRLAVATGEYVNLSILDRADVIYLLRLAGTQEREQPYLVGGRMPTFCTSNGRAMLAHLPEEEAREIVTESDRRPLTNASLTDPAKILRKVKEARDTGFSIVDEESEIGVISVGAAILDEAGLPAGAVNLPVSKRAWTVDKVRSNLAPQVVRVAETIGRSISGRTLRRF
jgi:IclR family transcriptional regulator, pca regulon regulatory protein